ncbi:MAG: Na+/H+ antiporter subunit E [Microthrixaceae bacterium]
MSESSDAANPDPTAPRSSRGPWGSFLMGLWLVAVWTLLWGTPTFANVVSGAVVAVVVLWAFPRSVPSHGQVALRPVRVAAFAGWFLVQLVTASLHVAWLVVRPSGLHHTRRGIVAVPVRGISSQLLIMVANAITLTPGTFTIEISAAPPVLYVHALESDHPDAIRQSVLDLERRIVRAFGTNEAVAALETSEIAPVEQVAR